VKLSLKALNLRGIKTRFIHKLPLFFKLNEDCFLVSGSKNGAIYNLISGEVFSINNISRNLLSACEKGLNVFDFILDQEIKNKDLIDFLSLLRKKKLGNFFSSDVSIYKLKIKKPPILEFVWVEISSVCNLSCFHCCGEFGFLANTDEPSASTSVFKKLLTDVYHMGCRRIQFIGGEPLMRRSVLRELILHSKKLGFTFIEVFTNGTILDENILRFFKSNDVKIAISIYGFKAIHENVTRTTGSYDKTITSIHSALKINIPVRVAIISMGNNEEDVDKLVLYLKKVGVHQIKIDIVRPAGRGVVCVNNSPSLANKYLIKKPIFTSCFLKDFARARYGHTCFSKNIYISNSGDVRPCVMDQDIIFGNIQREKISDILQKKSTKDIRGFSKDMVEKCKDCEFRYCCFGCYPVLKFFNNSNDLSVEPKNCFYNPYTGIWGTT